MTCEFRPFAHFYSKVEQQLLFLEDSLDHKVFATEMTAEKFVESDRYWRYSSSRLARKIFDSTTYDPRPILIKDVIQNEQTVRIY